MDSINYNEIFDRFATSFVGKEIKKDVILNKLINSDDKKIIEKFTNSFFIKYSVKAGNINKKAEENFEEIQILEININDYRAIYDVYGILLSIIPYPILAIFRYKNRISFAVSNRILAEDKNNKGKIYTSYLIKEENIGRYLKIDVDSCQTMIDIYNKWISNIEDVVAYYERLDRVMELIEIGFHIKSNEVLEKLESYITRDCGTYNMKPKDGWKSKLEKYSDDLPFVKKVETHILWEYLSENTFLKNKLEDFSNWNDFKESCSYSNSMNDIYYSQYNSRMLDNDEIDDVYEYRKNKSYTNRNTNIKVEIIKSESKQTDNLDNIIQDIVEEVKEKNVITYSDLAEILSERFGKANKKTINKVLEAFNKNNIEVIDNETEGGEEENYEFNEQQKQLLQIIENEPTVLEQADYQIKNDRVFMLQAIRIDNFCIRYASDELKNDKEFMLQAIEEEILNIEYASAALRDDKDFILKAAEIDNISLIYASDRLKNDKEFMLLLNEIDDKNLAYASDELKANKEFILSAAEKNIWALAFAIDELKNDKEFVSNIVEINSWTLKHASDELKNDKDIVLKAIRNDGWFLVYARNELRNNRNFLLEAINENKECVAFANDNLKNEILSDIDENNSITDVQKDDEEYMLKLIKKDYYNIRFASDRLRNDKDFILKSIKISDMGFKCLAYASDELKANKEFILKVFKKIGNYTFALASEKLKCDKEFILKLLEFNYLDFAYVGYELRSNKKFMMNAISKNAETIEFASYELKNDKEFVLQAIKINPLCFVYASDELKNDKEFMLQAIDTNFAVIEHAKDIFRNDKDVVLSALDRDDYGISLSHASDRLRNDKEFMLQVVKTNVKALKYLDEQLRNDSDFIIKAFEKDNRSIKYASDKLKNDKEFMLEINEIIEDSITLEYNYVFKDDFLDRNASYGLVGFLEGTGISVLEKDEFCMKIINRETGKIVECNHTPLYLVNEVLNEEEMDDGEWLVIEWKLHLSGTTEKNLKDFDRYMRSIKMPYSIYKNKKDGKNIIIENTKENIKFQEEKNPLYQYINQNFDKNDDFIIIQLYKIQPEIMMGISNVLHLLADKTNSEYRDYIAVLLQRRALGDSWRYSMRNNIEYIYLLGINIYKIPENILKEIEYNLQKFDVRYNIEKKIDDIILTMYPTKVEEIDFIIGILEKNNIEFETDDLSELDEIELAQTSLWMFETSKEEKEEISKILSEIDQESLNRLKDLGAPEIIIKNELAPVNCNYGIIVNSGLQDSIETILQSLNLEYNILDKDKYIIED